MASDEYAFCIVHDNPLNLQNSNLDRAEEDFLYHFGFGTQSLNVEKVFGDTKFVCTSGSDTKIKRYAEQFAKECQIPCTNNLSKSDYFVLYRTGKVVWVNHGMGNPSISIMLNEILKLMFHAKANDVKFIRLGTSGGIGVEPGTVVITKNTINGEFNEKYVQWIAGERVERDTFLDEGLQKDLLEVAKEKNIPVRVGYTMCSDDFYEGSMRLNSFLCDYKKDDKMAFLATLHDKGVINTEMESTCFSSITYRAGCKAEYPPFDLKNPNIDTSQEDFLYHFGFGSKSLDVEKVFGDTKFVCTGGSDTRMKLYAEQFAKECRVTCTNNLSKSDRFVLYKSGKVVWVNHGMGNPSLSIMLNEILKLMYYAKAKDVKFIRVGTSGGVGVEPGTVVITKKPINGELNEKYVQWIAAERVERDTFLDEGLQRDLIAVAKEKNIPVEVGYTMCADEFYEGQMRLDGFLCEYKSDDKMEFLKKLHDRGVRNIEMESACFSSMTYRAGCKAAVVCVTLLNRMKGDQINLNADQLKEIEDRPFKLVTALMKKQLGY